MADEAATLIGQEIRTARRLARLFRLAGSKRAEQSSEIALLLARRRDTVVAELTQIEAKRQPVTGPEPVELAAAMAALRAAVDGGERHCRGLIARLSAELGRLRGESATTGLRGDAGGQLLGQG
jgi:hypothetical protein